MGFSRNVGFLPRPCFGDPWCWSVVGAPTSHLPQAPPPTQRQLLTGPMGSAGGSPTKFGKSPATQPHVIYDAALPNDILLGRGKSIQNRPANVRFREMLDISTLRSTLQVEMVPKLFFRHIYGTSHERRRWPVSQGIKRWRLG
jgi:hypothetical protein